MSHVHASPCIRTPFSIYLLYLNCLELYLIVSFFPFSLLFTLVVSMAPKYKSTPPQNLLCFGASSSSDPTPSHIWFRDEDARKDFSKNFSRRVFIWNTESFCRISPTLTYPLSFTVRVESHCVTSWSLLLPC